MRGICKRHLRCKSCRSAYDPLPTIAVCSILTGNRVIEWRIWLSKRRALRNLASRFPDSEKADALIMGLHKESDHAAAIIATSLVETVLERLLIASFPNKSKELLPSLFGNKGPLSDFNSKILIADAYCVEGANCGELHRVRHIRNCFAHARELVTFETEEIAQEVDDFAAAQAIRKVREVYQVKGEMSGYENFGRKASFILSCHLLILMMNETHVKLGGGNLIGQQTQNCL